MGKQGVYKTIPGEGEPVVFTPLGVKEWYELVKRYGGYMSITEFLFTSQKNLNIWEKIKN
jgi:hypothetical protein